MTTATVVMTVKCAWCPKDAPPLVEGTPGATVSHTMCSECERKFNAKIDALPVTV